MRLYLVQHGEAKSKEEDPKRRLTEQGRLDVASTGRFLEQAGLIIPEIWHSEKARARETAEIIGQALGTARLVQKAEMAPLDPVKPIRGAILNRKKDLMMVGHLPFLSHLANLLLGCPAESQVIGFRQGGIVCLERNKEGNWQVVFMVNPRLLE